MTDEADELRRQIEQNVIYVSPEAWEQLQRELNEPPKDAPKLRALLKRRAPFAED